MSRIRAILAALVGVAGVSCETFGASWVRPDGVSVVAQAGALFSVAGSGVPLVAPIDVRADGTTYVDTVLIAAGSSAPDAVGTKASTCDDWRGLTTGAAMSIGHSSSANSTFFRHSATGCTGLFTHVYCLQE